MMKISKPILTNDFLLSPVQFTSLNTIVFKNVKNVYDGNEKILLEYEHSSKIEASSRDWIGIFPGGWSTLHQYVTFEWASQSLPTGHNEQNKENGDLTRRTIHFSPKYHKSSVCGNSFYQFVYISKQIEVLGVSSFFRFDMSATNSESTLELECLVPVSTKIRSTSFSDIGILMANKVSSTTSLDTRTLQTTSIHSLQNLEPDGKNWAKPHIPMSITDFKKPSAFPRKSAGTGDALDPYSSHSEPVFPMSFPVNQCKKCFHFKKGGEFLRSQQVLQSKVGPRSEEASQFIGQRRTLGHAYLSEDKLKIVMERNKVLEERTQEMKKEMERLQAESKRLKTTFYNTNKEKIAYEKFVKDFIKSLEKDSVVRVVNGNTEFLVKKVNYVGMEEHPRDKKTSKRERELKAVIGLQEITIRNLINSLQEKAKSVQELNQTVKLAQAFSAARGDSREYGSDAEETDEVSNSDVASEYEFSLTKPTPPEEVTVDNADAVLDGIRRTTELELKDIGISRSLGKSSSRESSELELPSLSVRGYQNQNEGTTPKKPRLFDSVEDCWPFPDTTPKVVQRKILEPNPNFENENVDDPDQEFGIEAETEAEAEAEAETETETKAEPRPTDPILESPTEEPEEPDKPEPCELFPAGSNKELGNLDVEGGNGENYYDACEAFNLVVPTKEEAPKESRELFSEKNEDNKKEKKNFLLTAIVPRDLDVKPQKNVEEWLKGERGDPEEKKPEMSEKSKKFTCQVSIDFAAKVLPNTTEEGGTGQLAIDNKALNETQNQASDSFDIVTKHSAVQPKDESSKEKPVLSVKKTNKCVEIQITQVDQKENLIKNYVHQKMVVKFGKDPQPEAETRSSKFEINLAVTGLKEKGKFVQSTEQIQIKNENELKLGLNEETNTETNVSPRTVWNDATEDITEDVVAQEEAQSNIPLEKPKQEEEEEEEQAEQQQQQGGGTEEIEEDKENEVLEETPEESNVSDMNVYQDSLRYEKNLEFLQQKTEEKIKEEEISKDKPTAILIQNGQTKLALIRYQ